MYQQKKIWRINKHNIKHGGKNWKTQILVVKKTVLVENLGEGEGCWVVMNEVH